MSYAALSSRLRSGRPLVIGADMGASLRAQGVELAGPGALGALLRKDPDRISEHHAAETRRRVDILSALTADTTPRALAEVGMEHRAAMLTGRAIDLAQDVALGAARPVAVAGVLGSDQVTSIDYKRFEAEIHEHALRVYVAGPELMIVRGMGSIAELCLAVQVSTELELPTWAVVDLEMSRESRLDELLEGIVTAGAEVVLFEIPTIEQALDRLARVAEWSERIVPGVMLAACPDAVRGFPAELKPGWVSRAMDLVEAGARVVGGGAGTTAEHSEALATALGQIHPSFPPVLDSAELGA